MSFYDLLKIVSILVHVLINILGNAISRFLRILYLINDLDTVFSTTLINSATAYRRNDVRATRTRTYLRNMVVE